MNLNIERRLLSPLNKSYPKSNIVKIPSTNKTKAPHIPNKPSIVIKSLTTETSKNKAKQQQPKVPTTKKTTIPSPGVENKTFENNYET